MMLTIKDIKKDDQINHYLDRADTVMGAIGFTEHGRRHAGVVARRASSVLEALERPSRQCELAAIAAYLHDIGNAVNREFHAQSGAILAHDLLHKAGMEIDEILDVVSAIGHHHETDGAPVSDVAAALILADKSDVHRSRVRNKEMIQLDIHDRVNYAVTQSTLKVLGPREAREMEGERGGEGEMTLEAGPGDDGASVTFMEKEGDAEDWPRLHITLSLEIDTSIAPVMEYFEIFLPRMVLSSRAADRLGAVYKLMINETHLL